jgi:hypothetical protein
VNHQTKGRSVGSRAEIVFLFLGALSKLRKATISVVMSALLSVRMEQLGSHWTDFHEIWHFRFFFFENLAQKFKFH